MDFTRAMRPPNQKPPNFKIPVALNSLCPLRFSGPATALR